MLAYDAPFVKPKDFNQNTGIYEYFKCVFQHFAQATYHRWNDVN